jgi:hypothetical protein
MEECVYKAVQEMIKRMKEEIAKTQNVQYSEQIVVAEIYNIVANNLAEACRVFNKGKKENCTAPDKLKKTEITLDTFILLKQLKEDKMISEEYSEQLFETLLKINPAIKEQVEKDRAVGLI